MSSLTLNGFISNRLDRNNNGGGVIAYFRANLRPTILCDLQDIAAARDLECTITKIQIQGIKTPAVILGVYRPPNSKAKWFEDMSGLITDILPLGSIIIMGDLNADLLHPKIMPGKSLKTMLKLANATVHNVQPTRITLSTATCLDIIAIDKTIPCLDYVVGDLSLSDHLPVLASIKIKNKQAMEPIVKRSMRDVNFDTMRSRAAQIQLSIGANSPVDEVVESWHRSLLQIVDDMAPIKNYPWRRERCPWLTDGIRRLMNKRTFLVNRIKKVNEAQVSAELKVVKKQIKSQIRREMKNAGRKALDQNDPKKAWQFIKSATFTHTKASEDHQDPTLLNAYFASTVSAKNSVQLQPTIGCPQHPLFSLRNVTVEEVFQTLKKTDSAATAGTDGLSGQMIKELVPAIAQNVCDMFNMSINQSCFPQTWKKANVTAIWKGKGAKGDPSNYRPISILPIVARAFEKMVTAQLSHYCYSNSIIPDQQFGFRSKSSCEIALLKATDCWITQVDSGMYVGALLIDLSKAFDSVPHQKLLDELSSIGCDSAALQWFTSYLSKREQRVTQKGAVTPWMPISQGVPQGSGLSPLLFNIYVRNLPSSTGSTVIQFADDVTASEAHKDIEAVQQGLTTAYNNIKRFCNERGLTLNASKTQLIIFKTPSRKLPEELELLLDGHSVKPLHAVKLLGFVLDQHFTWGEHIDKTVKRCTGLIGAMAKAAPCLTRKLLLMAYTALVRSHLEYCSSLLLSASRTQLEKLDVLQRKAARTILQVPRDSHAAPLLEMLSLDSLKDRRAKHALTIIQNILSGNCHPALADFFVLLPDETISAISKPRLKLGNKRFRATGADIYNHYAL